MELRLSNRLGKLVGFEGGVWGWLPLSYLEGHGESVCVWGYKERREKVLTQEAPGLRKSSTSYYMDSTESDSAGKCWPKAILITQTNKFGAFSR